MPNLWKRTIDEQSKLVIENEFVNSGTAEVLQCPKEFGKVFCRE